MLYKATISIPASTLETNPTIETLIIARGIITEIKVRPRAGHCALAHLTISYHGHQIAPSTEGMSITGDYFPIDWGEYYEIYQPDYVLKLKGWNESTRYTHSFDVFVVVIPRKALSAKQSIESLEDVLSLLSPRRIYTGGG